jgi:hypothetical protein
MQYAIVQVRLAAIAGSSIPTLINVPSNLTNGINVSVVVSQSIDPTSGNPPLTQSSIFNQQMQVIGSQSSIVGNKITGTSANPFASLAASDYRYMTATANNHSSSLSVILGPGIPSLSDPELQALLAASNQKPAFLPYFSSAVLANSSFTLLGSVNFNSSQPRQTNLITNGLMSLGGTSRVDGNLIAYSATTNTSPVSGSNSITVLGNIDTNAQSPPAAQFQSDYINGIPNLTGNVWGDSQLLQQTGSITPNDGSVNPSIQAPVQIPSITGLAAVSPPENGNIAVSSASSSTVSELGTINLTGTQSMTLNPGQYVVTSINVPATASLIVNGPVTVYVADSPSTGTPAISIQGTEKLNAPAAANNFQVFYGGDQSVSVNVPSGGTYSGLIYAPNASTSLNFNKSAQFNGAVSANKVSVTGPNLSPNSPLTPTFSFDPSTITLPGGGTASAGPGYLPPSPQAVTQPARQSQTYQVLSWQEK